MYRNGQGVPQGYVESARWYRLAAEHANVTAQYIMGTLYYSGQGLKQDDTTAYSWFVVAESNGNKVASDRIKTIKERINPRQIESALEGAKAILAKLKNQLD